MQKISLYRYTRPDGGVTVSAVKPDIEYTEMTRLVADEGHTLTDGNTTTPCADTDNPDVWSEVEDTENLENPDEASVSDYQAALRDMGVEL